MSQNTKKHATARRKTTGTPTGTGTASTVRVDRKVADSVRRKIELRYSNGACVPVMAVAFGSFGVHVSRMSDGTAAQGWTVTHIPSGWACGNSFHRRVDAIGCARELASVRVRWDFTDPVDMPAMTKKRGGSVVRRWIAINAAVKR